MDASFTRKPLYWVGGWASDLDAWGDELDARFPEYSLRFLCAHNFLASGDRVQDLLEAAPPDAALAGWSLGALLVEKWLTEGRVPKTMPVVSICPFLDFCAPDGPWAPRVLRAMTRRLFGDAQGVLTDFATRCGLEAGPRHELWMRQATALGEASLADGLQALADLRLERWADHPRRRFLVAPDDRVSPPTPTPEALTELLPEGSGHVPFLNRPEAFDAALRAFLEEAA